MHVGQATRNFWACFLFQDNNKNMKVKIVFSVMVI